MTVSVRRLRPGEECTADQITALFKAAAPSGQSTRFLANPANYLIVAEADSQVVGFALAYRLDRLDRQAKQLFVYEVGVLPHWQRQGIGSAVMEFVREVVVTEGLMEAFVLTDRTNQAARKLYSRTGGQIESDASTLFVYPGHAA